MNQVFLTGRVLRTSVDIGKNVTTELMVAAYQYEPDTIEYIPAIINDNTKTYINNFKCGDLVSIIGKLKYENGSIIVIVEKINYAG